MRGNDPLINLVVADAELSCPSGIPEAALGVAFGAVVALAA